MKDRQICPKKYNDIGCIVSIRHLQYSINLSHGSVRGKKVNRQMEQVVSNPIVSIMNKKRQVEERRNGSFFSTLNYHLTKGIHRSDPMAIEKKNHSSTILLSYPFHSIYTCKIPFNFFFLFLSFSLSISPFLFELFHLCFIFLF